MSELMKPCAEQSWRGREFRRWRRPPRGATAMEYMVLILLVALSLIAIIELFAGGVQNQFQAVVDIINEDMGRETEEGRQRREEREAAKRKERQASMASSSGTQQQAAAAPETTTDEVPIADSSPPASGSVGGINPVVFIIGLGLLLLLGYVVFGKKKGG